MRQLGIGDLARENIRLTCLEGVLIDVNIGFEIGFDRSKFSKDIVRRIEVSWRRVLQKCAGTLPFEIWLHSVNQFQGSGGVQRD